MKRLTQLAPLLLALSAALSACTGTEEDPLALRLAVLSDGGATLQAITVNEPTSTPPVTVNNKVTVQGGVRLDTLPSGRALALTRSAAIEQLDANLAVTLTFPSPGFDSTCLIRTATSAARDRLLTLSECSGGPQRLALYRSDGTLIWTALLPTFLPPTPTNDTPPVRLAVQGDVGLVARPTLSGSSEVMRVAVTTTGNTVAEVSIPQNTISIYDLIPYNSDILAATASGIQKLAPSGLPDANSSLAAFGSVRYDRLWSGTGATRNLLAAWRSNVLNTSSYEPLYLWDGVLTKAATVNSYVADLRDLTLAPDGYLYALTATTLTRYDTVFGLRQNTWNPRDLQSALNDARAVSWVIPPE